MTHSPQRVCVAAPGPVKFGWTARRADLTPILELQRRFDFANHGVKGGRIGDRDFRKALAVQFDIRRFQAGDELAVPQVAFAAGGAEARDPKATKIALAGAAVAEGECAGPLQGFFDGSEQSAAA